MTSRFQHEAQNRANALNWLDNVWAASNQRAAARDRARAVAQQAADWEVAYLRHLAVARKTGYMPVEYQRTTSEDFALVAYAEADCLRRALAALDPAHPLLQPRVRDLVTILAKVKFNDAGRPDGCPLGQFAPTDTELGRIYRRSQEGGR